MPMNGIHEWNIKEDFSFYALWFVYLYIYYFCLYFKNEIFKDPFNR